MKMPNFKVWIRGVGKALLISILATPLVTFAASPAELLSAYGDAAKKMDPRFQGFSPAEGKKIYDFVGVRNGEKISCSSCHTNDPRNVGKSKTGKEIRPLAPSANAERFTDSGKVEKWFRRNCNDVFSRECTVKEKGDFIAYVRSL